MLTCLVIIGWFAVFAMMIRAVIVKDILWPQKQEDRAEGGWKAPLDEEHACDTRMCEPRDASTSARARRHSDSALVDGVENRSRSYDESSRSVRSLPVIAEGVIGEVIHGRRLKQNEDIV